VLNFQGDLKGLKGTHLATAVNTMKYFLFFGVKSLQNSSLKIVGFVSTEDMLQTF